jgi:hypothetical protein
MLLLDLILLQKNNLKQTIMKKVILAATVITTSFTLFSAGCGNDQPAPTTPCIEANGLNRFLTNNNSQCYNSDGNSILLSFEDNTHVTYSYIMPNYGTMLQGTLGLSGNTLSGTVYGEENFEKEVILSIDYFKDASNLCKRKLKQVETESNETITSYSTEGTCVEPFM